MNWLNLFLGVVAPLIIPFYDLIFNLGKGTKKPNRVIGMKGSAMTQYSTPQKEKNVFIAELPSAFIGTSIWGLTYQIDYNSDANLIWLTIWLISIFTAVGFYFAEKSIADSKKFTVTSIIFELVLIVLVSIRIFCTNQLTNPIP